MAKRIIILEKLSSGRFKYVLWADVPASRQAFYANPLFASAYKAASAAEILALQNGQVTEYLEETAIPTTATLAQIQATLEANWQRFQTEVTNSNPWNRYGSFWDGTTWTLGGVA